MARARGPGADGGPADARPRAALAELVAVLDRSQWLAPARIEAAQALHLARLVAHHAAHSAVFRARLAEADLRAGDLDSLGALRRLPPIRRRDVQRAGPAFRAAQVPDAYRPLGDVKTSGSTGEPVALRKTAVNRRFWTAFNVRDYLWHGREAAQRLSAIRANIDTYSEQPGWLPLHRTGPAQRIPITTDIREQLRLLRAFEPEVVLVYPSNLAAFATIWEEAGFAPASIRHIKTIGETVSPELRERIRRATGLAIEDQYSTQEAGTAAIQCPVSGLYHVMAEALILEVLDEAGQPCPEGGIGRIVLTDLHNLAAPLIRYDIGDYAEAGSVCPCGRGLPTLRRIVGRERNLIAMPDGSRHWPLVGFHRFDEVVPVRQYQLIQHSLREIEFRVVTDEALSPAQAAGLIGIAQAALRHPFEIRLVPFQDRLPLARNGKFEEFVSRVAA